MSNYRTAKFWNRLGAILIDSLILGIFGFLLGLIFKDYFISLGNNGIFIGFVISLIYFSFGNSKLFGGQTLGKRLTYVKVIDKDDKLLSIKKSFVRSFILTFPYFFIGFIIPGLPENSAIQIIKYDLLLLVLFGFIYFYLFNKSTRQSLHDIIVKSYVVDDYMERESLERSKIKPKICYIFYASSIVLFAATIYFSFRNNSSLDELIVLQAQLKNIEGVKSVSVNQNTTTVFGSNSVTKSLTCSLNVSQIVNNNSVEGLEKNEMVKKTTKIVIDNYPNFKALDYLTIRINRGYNIGISHANNSIWISKSPSEWIDITKE